MKKWLAWALTLSLLVGIMPLHTALAASISLNVGTPVENVQFHFSWSKVDGASYYEYSVRNTSTGQLYYDHARTEGRSSSIYKGDIWAGCGFRFWVGAYDADGNMLAQAQTERTAIACSHSDTYEEIVGSKDISCEDESTHSIFYVFNEICEDCGQVVYENNSIYYEEDHQWDSNDVCTVCGYEYWEECSEADHQNPDNLISTKIGAIPGTSISDTQHTGVQYKYLVRCRICAEEWEDWRTEGTASHIFTSSGDCEVCDYRAGCKHESTVDVLMAEPSWVVEDENKHSRTFKYNLVCANADCGEVFEYNYRSEKETGDHTFSSNVCTVCGYSRVVPDISVSVSVDSTQAETGAQIGATCNIQNGSGSYTLGWIIYKDGSMIEQGDYSKRCTIIASSAGSYQFKAIYYDQVYEVEKTAWSAKIQVSVAVCEHADYTVNKTGIHSYESLSSTRHQITYNVEYVCNDCGEIFKTGTLSPVDAVEAHSFSNNKCTKYGVKGTVTAAPVTEKPVTAAPVTEKPVTAAPITENPITPAPVTEKPVTAAPVTPAPTTPAPIAGSTTCAHNRFEWRMQGDYYYQPHNNDYHKRMYKEVCYCLICEQAFGTEVHESFKIMPHEYVDGICTCGQIQHTHNYSINLTFAEEHPHKGSGYCECGAFSNAIDMKTQNLNCCLCSGHIWDTLIPAGNMYMQNCTRCSAQQIISGTADVDAFYDLINNFQESARHANGYTDNLDIDVNSSRIWKVIALQATGKLQDGGFVYTKYGLDAASDMSGTISDAVLKGLKIVDEKTWDEQKQEYWTEILIELLNQEAEKSEKSNKTSQNANFLASIAEKIADNTGEKSLEFSWASGNAYYQQNAINEWIAEIDAQLQELEDTKYDADFSGSYYDRHNELSQKRVKLLEINSRNDGLAEEYESKGKDYAQQSKIAGNINTALEVFSIVYDSTAAIDQMNKKLDDLNEILSSNSHYVEILDSIIDCSGSDSNLAKAAAELKEKLEKESEQATNRFMAGLETGLEKAKDVIIDSSSEKAVDAVLEAIPSYLDTVELVGKVLDTIFDWDAAFSSAEKLMTLSVMDTEMNVLHASQNSENYQYYAQLWALLQAKGDEHAVQVLDEWHAGRGLSMEDYGISTDKERLLAKAELSNEHGRYRYLLDNLGWEGEIDVIDIWENE